MVVGTIERGNYIDKYGWCRLYQENIETILKYSNKIVELGAGSGYIRYLIKCKGGDNVEIDSYDIKSNDQSNTFQNDWNQQEWEKQVMTGDHTVLNSYNEQFDLLLVWPPPQNDLAINSLKIFKGSKVIFIGEPPNGMCATLSFFEELSKNWTLVHEESVNSFNNFKDKLFIFNRLPNEEISKQSIKRIQLKELTLEENCERSIKLNLDDIDTLLKSKDIEEIYEANEKLVSSLQNLFSMTSLPNTVRDELNILIKNRSKILDKAMMNKIPFNENPFTYEGATDLNSHPLIPNNCIKCNQQRSTSFSSNINSNNNKIFKAFNRYGELIVKCFNCNIECIDINKWVCSNMNCKNILLKELNYHCNNNNHFCI